MRAIVSSFLALLALGAAASCGSDSDGAPAKPDACLWECDFGSGGENKSCVSYAGLSEAKCQQVATESCASSSAKLVHVQRQPGCGCPAFADTEECRSAPAWYWGNACFFQCGGKAADCVTARFGAGPIETEADCQQAAKEACVGSVDAGSAPEHVELMTGCACPTFGNVGECTTLPTWFQ